MADLGAGQELYKISLDHLVVTESKEVLEKPHTTQNTKPAHCCRGCQSNKESIEKEPKGQSRNLRNKTNKVVLEYNSNYKTNPPESLLIEMTEQVNKWRRDKSPVHKNSKYFM